jgi:hypothetical protein
MSAVLLPILMNDRSGNWRAVVTAGASLSRIVSVSIAFVNFRLIYIDALKIYASVILLAQRQVKLAEKPA